MGKRVLFQFLAGIMFCLGGAVLIFFGVEDIPLPVKVSLLVVGVALIAMSKHRI